MAQNPHHVTCALAEELEEGDGPRVGLVHLLTWIGQAKGAIALTTAATTGIALAGALLMTPVFTARTTLLPPGSEHGGSAA